MGLYAKLGVKQKKNKSLNLVSKILWGVSKVTLFFSKYKFYGIDSKMQLSAQYVTWLAFSEFLHPDTNKLLAFGTSLYIQPHDKFLQQKQCTM